MAASFQHQMGILRIWAGFDRRSNAVVLLDRDGENDSQWGSDGASLTKRPNSNTFCRLKYTQRSLPAVEPQFKRYDEIKEDKQPAAERGDRFNR